MLSTCFSRGVLLALFFSAPALAADALKPSKYLDPAAEQKLVDSVPPPPAADSPEDKADLAADLAAQNARTPEIIAEAKLDQHFSPQLFQPVYGAGITDTTAPKLKQLLKDVAQTTSVLNGAAKNKFRRLRPFQDHPDVIQALFQVDGFSYPSGHAMASYTMAVVLGAVFPDKKDAFLARAGQIAQSRVNAGVHYPSDIKEGEALGRAAGAAILATPAFQSGLAAVQAELKK